MNHFKIWDELEEIRARNLNECKDELHVDHDKRIIVNRMQQTQRDLVTIAFCLQRLIAPLE